MSTNGTVPTMEQLTSYAYQQADTIDLLNERLAELEMSLSADNWRRLSGESDREFSREALAEIIYRSRMAYLSNPLVRHGVEVQTHYVFGQPISWEALDAQIQEVAQAFWDDPDNQTELTSQQAMLDKERQLQTDGNLFIAHFINPLTGEVRLRSIMVDEIQQIICNPDDDKEPWYYRRSYSRRVLNVATGVEETRDTTEYYPDWRYEPTTARPLTINGKAVRWGTPVRHIKVGGFGYMRFGIPEAYAALDWARAVRNDLEDYATVKRALSRFAWNLTVKGGGSKAVSEARTKLNSTLGNGPRGAETNPPPLVGSTFIGSDMASMEPIRTSGAQASPDDGRRLGLMVAAGMGIPETILFGDAEVGNLATAKTLDRPTEMKMRMRQSMWEAILKDEINFAVDWAVRAAGGPLSGTVRREQSRVIVDMGSVDRHIDIDFPSILERDTKALVDAIVAAANTNALHPEMIARQLMGALGVDDIDEEMKQLEPILAHKVEMILNPPQPAFGPDDDERVPPRRNDVDEAMIEAAQQLRDALVRLSEGQAA